MTTFHIISLFPESFESYLNVSIVKRAREKGKISVKYYNPRDFVVAAKKNRILTYADRRVDDRPYGGGPGMVIEALPVIKAIDKAIGSKISRSIKSKAGQRNAKVKIVFFSPAGESFTNKMAESFKSYSDIVLVCGRYEGIDARVKKAFPMTDISIGPYILSGGELPAMIMIDAITRRIPGVLGDDLSVEESRISCADVYTRPSFFEYKKKRYTVPKILLQGHHAKIDAWKQKRSKSK